MKFKKNNLSASSSLRQKSALFKLCLLCSVFSGCAFNLIGILYVGDILMLGGAVFLALYLLNSDYSIRPYFGYLILLTSGVGAFFLLDLYNGISGNDILRGLSKHLVFISSIIVSLFLLDFFGLYKSLVLFLVFICSLGLMVMVGLSVERDGLNLDLYSFIKYLNGFYVMILFILLTKRSIFTMHLIGLFSILVLIMFLDFRTGSLIILGGFLGYYFFRLALRLSAWITATVFMVFTFFAFSLISNFLTDDKFFDSNVIERRLESNRQRSDMSDFAIQEFLIRPYTGYGSWQSANRYVDPQNTQQYIGIHSMILQYAHEYGITGIVWSIFIFGIAVRAIRKIPILMQSAGIAETMVTIMFILVLFYSVVFGGLGGYGRFSLAFSLSLCIYYDARKSRVINHMKPIQS